MNDAPPAGGADFATFGGCGKASHHITFTPSSEHWPRITIL
ncbi:hypothetical protein LG3211_2441 [Lysobacter gummosus]|nr:hypothetical protein LG3211_2441 [Lysobacter gummosus]